jgi:hypothetical protein
MTYEQSAHDQFVKRLALEVADSMDNEALWAFAVETLEHGYSLLDGDDLARVVTDFAPQLFDELMELPK